MQDRLRIARSRQKSNANNRRRNLEFQVVGRVFLKVLTVRGTLGFRKKGKLAPRYIGPFRIKSKIGGVAYRLEFPLELTRIHDVFQFLMLSHVKQHEPLEIREDATYVEKPMRIIDTKEQVLCTKTIRWVKVL